MWSPYIYFFGIRNTDVVDFLLVLLLLKCRCDDIYNLRKKREKNFDVLFLYYNIKSITCLSTYSIANVLFQIHNLFSY